MTLQDSIRAIIVRELRTLQQQLLAYADESRIWSLPPGISNSAGTLTLHLAGNLQAFVGAALGGSGYERDRPAEFSRREVPREELLTEIERTLEVVDATLRELPDPALEAPYPLDFNGLQVTTSDFLGHLASHLSFHLGQIDYHRRLVTGENRSVGPLPISQLASVSGQR